jgi:hypothetical protein
VYVIHLRDVEAFAGSDRLIRLRAAYEGLREMSRRMSKRSFNRSPALHDGRYLGRKVTCEQAHGPLPLCPMKTALVFLLYIY